MFHWRRCAPYNAVHAVLIRESADVERLTQAVAETNRSVGLGGVEFDFDRCLYRYVPEPVESVQSRTVDELEDDTIARVMSEELNRSFSDEVHAPVRWQVLSTPSQDRHAIVVTYDHVVADAFAVQALIAEVLTRYAGSGLTDDASIRLAVPDAKCFRGSSLFPLRSLAALTRQYFRFRHAYRLPEHAPERVGCGVRIGHQLVRIPQGFTEQARSRGVRLNGCVIGAMVKAVAEVTPKRVEKGRRKSLAVSTIESVRNLHETEPVLFDARLDTRFAFIAAPDGDAFEMARMVSQELGRKGRRVTGRGSSAAGQAFAIRHVWSLLGIQNDPASYRKLFPLCAGVSPFRVDEARYAALGSRVDRVLRACPIGPALPLVAAATIRGGSIELVLTFRRACFGDEQAAALLRRAIENLESIIRCVMS